MNEMKVRSKNNKTRLKIYNQIGLKPYILIHNAALVTKSKELMLSFAIMNIAPALGISSGLLYTILFILNDIIKLGGII